MSQNFNLKRIRIENKFALRGISMQKDIIHDMDDLA